MSYRHLFFDLDHTLWDFEANAKITMLELYESLGLKERGIDDFDKFYKNYLVLNEKLWERYRKGFIKQDELRFKRMWLSLLEFKIADDELANEMNTRFLDLLPTRTILFHNTIEILTYLTGKKYQLHLITNGFEKTQHSKLKYSGLGKFFTEVITSEGSNSLKPDKEIFDFAFEKTYQYFEDKVSTGTVAGLGLTGDFRIGIGVKHGWLPIGIGELTMVLQW